MHTYRSIYAINTCQYQYISIHTLTNNCTLVQYFSDRKLRTLDFRQMNKKQTNKQMMGPQETTFLFQHLHVAIQRYNTDCLSPNSITPTFTKTSPRGKSWTQIMKVADTNSDKSGNHEVSVKVANTNHESCGHKPSRHVEMFVTKSVTSSRQTRLCRSNGI